jgi:hypothetical protein
VEILTYYVNFEKKVGPRRVIHWNAIIVILENEVITECAHIVAKAGKLTEYPLVCIIWDDAHMSMDEYSSVEVERDFHKAEQVKSFGLLVREDDKGITLAQDEGVTDGKFRHIIFIPSGMLVEKIDLGVPRRKQERVPRKQRKRILPSSPESPDVPPADSA